MVDDIGDGHTIPSYNPSLVTPAPSQDPAAPGGCNYCHEQGLTLFPVLLSTAMRTTTITPVYSSLLPVAQIRIHATGVMMFSSPKIGVSASVKAATVMNPSTISRLTQTGIAVLPWVKSYPVTAMWELTTPAPPVTAGAAMASPYQPHPVAGQQFLLSPALINWQLSPARTHRSPWLVRVLPTPTGPTSGYPAFC